MFLLDIVRNIINIWASRRASANADRAERSCRERSLFGRWLILLSTLVVMCIRFSFNSAFLFAACGLLITDKAYAFDGPPRDDPRCSKSLSRILENNNTRLPEDKSLYNWNDIYWTDGNLTYGCICRLLECIRKCCGSDEVLREDFTKETVCEAWQGGAATVKPIEKDLGTKPPDLRLSEEQLAQEINHLDKLILKTYFLLIPSQSVCTVGRYALNPRKFEEDKVTLQPNGSLINADGKIFQFWNYCIDWQVTSDRIGILVCVTPEIQAVSKSNEKYIAHHIDLMISIPFLFATFLIYAIIPELRNLYGKTLMCYVICLITAYIFLILANYIYISPIRSLCFITAFVIYFSFLASFFWLNVMCFDIWWTFGGFRSLQGSANQRERKKFIIYSIYAWGCASILTIVCAIMDFVPGLSKNLIRPEFGADRCWFAGDSAKALYFYGPMGITVVCNICLFISTALKIVQHKKDTAHQLRSSESRRHDDNKQWFNLYLKLFIVMGINWSMEIISWLFKSAPQYVWYITDLTNTLQGLIIFIIFVWKDKIRRLLLKRFGCQDRGLFSRNSNRSGYHSSTSRNCTTTTTSGVMSLQEKVSPLSGANYRVKNSSMETNCP